MISSERGLAGERPTLGDRNALVVRGAPAVSRDEFRIVRRVNREPAESIEYLEGDIEQFFLRTDSSEADFFETKSEPTSEKLIEEDREGTG